MGIVGGGSVSSRDGPNQTVPALYQPCIGKGVSNMHDAPTWDPQQYLRHSGHRTRPFHDLLNRIPDLPRQDRAARIADLGCGPGNVTAQLTTRWPDAHITGYDNSPEMLKEAETYAGPTPGGGHLDFAPADAADWTPEETYDLIVSNAALQWVPDHPDSFARWIEALAPGGTFAFQVPGNFTSPSHALLGELCDAPSGASGSPPTAAASSMSSNRPTTWSASPTSAAPPTSGKPPTSSSWRATIRSSTGSKAPPCAPSSRPWSTTRPPAKPSSPNTATPSARPTPPAATARSSPSAASSPSPGSRPPTDARCPRSHPDAPLRGDPVP